jgi:hypothetical protein
MEPLNTAEIAANAVFIFFVTLPFIAAIVADRLRINTIARESVAENACETAIRFTSIFFTIDPFNAAETDDRTSSAFLDMDPLNADEAATISVFDNLETAPDIDLAEAAKDIAVFFTIEAFNADETADNPKLVFLETDPDSDDIVAAKFFKNTTPCASDPENAVEIPETNASVNFASEPFKEADTAVKIACTLFAIAPDILAAIAVINVFVPFTMPPENAAETADKFTENKVKFCDNAGFTNLNGLIGPWAPCVPFIPEGIAPP